jgi:steroid 5-alpha reductase family enzyme
MWWAFYLFAVAAKGGHAAGQDAWLQPILAGPVLLSLLFQGSTPFTEDITLRKYPGAPCCLRPPCCVLTLRVRAAYAEYQKKVSRLIPLPPSGRMK